MSGETGYIHEPFNPNRAPGWLAEPLPYWFMHITDENAARYEPAMRNLLAMRYPLWSSVRRTRSAKQMALHLPEAYRSVNYRVRGVRPLLKDPLALFSAEWLAERFNTSIVVMIRHPAAFVSSIKRLNWGFDYERHWLAQDLLMRDYLGHRAAEFEGYQGEVDLVGEGIVIWNAVYDVVSGYRDRHPDWSFVRHEDLAEDPFGGFKTLYGALDLTWSDKVERGIEASTGSQNPKEVPEWRRRAIKRDSRAARRTWLTRLTPEEIERIREGVSEIAARFYSDEDWAPG